MPKIGCSVCRSGAVGQGAVRYSPILDLTVLWLAGLEGAGVPDGPCMRASHLIAERGET